MKKIISYILCAAIIATAPSYAFCNQDADVIADLDNGDLIIEETINNEETIASEEEIILEEEIIEEEVLDAAIEDEYNDIVIEAAGTDATYPVDFADSTYTLIKKYDFEELSAGSEAKNHLVKKGGASSRKVVKTAGADGKEGKAVEITILGKDSRYISKNLFSNSDIKSGKRYRISLLAKMADSSPLSSLPVQMKLFADTNTTSTMSSGDFYVINKTEWTKVAYEFDGGKYKPGSAGIVVENNTAAQGVFADGGSIIYYIDDFTIEEVTYDKREYTFDEVERSPIYLNGTLTFSKNGGEEASNAIKNAFTAGSYVYTDNMFSGMKVANGAKYKVSIRAKASKAAKLTFGAFNSNTKAEIVASKEVSADTSWNTYEGEFVANNNFVTLFNSGATSVFVKSDTEMNLLIDSIKIEKVLNLDPDTLAKVSIEGGNLVISGILEAGNEGKQIKVDVTDEIGDRLIDTLTCTVGDDLTYSVSTPLFEIEESEMDVIIILSDLLVYEDGTFERTYKYANLGAIINVLQKIKTDAQITSADDIKTLLTNTANINLLKLNEIEIYNELEDKDDVFAYVFANRLNVVNEEITYDTTPLKEMIVLSSLLSVIKNGTVEKIANVLSDADYVAILGIANLAEYNEYKALIDKNGVISSFKGSYLNTADFVKAFKDAVNFASYEESLKSVIDFNDRTSLPSQIEKKNVTISFESGINYPENEQGNAMKLNIWNTYGFINVSKLFDNIPIVEGKKYKVSFDAKITNDGPGTGSAENDENWQVHDKGSVGIYLVPEAGVITPILAPAASSYRDIKYTQLTRDKWTKVELEFVADSTFIEALGGKKPVIAIQGDQTLEYGGFGTRQRLFVYADNFTAQRIVSDDINELMDIKADTNGLTVSGSLEIENANKTANIYVIDEGFCEDTTSGEGILATKTVTVGADGKYEVFIPRFDMDKYITNVTVSLSPAIMHFNERVSRSYEYKDLSFTKSALETFVAYTDNALAINYLKQNKQIFEYENIDIFNYVTDLDFVLNYIYKNKNRVINAQDAYDLSFFTLVAKEGMCLDILENGTTDEIEYILDNLADVLTINKLNSYTKTYSELTDKGDAISVIKGEYASIDVFFDEFTEKLVKAVIKKAATYSAAVKIAYDNKDELGIDFSYYDAITNQDTKSSVAESFASYLKSASNYDNATQKLNEFISSYSSNSSSSSKGSSGGSSGSFKPVTSGVTIDTNSYNTLNGSNVINEKYQNRYSDIDSVVWAWESINALSDKGIISGYGDDSFRPSNNITRAEVAKILAEAFELTGENVDSKFLDVSADDWYAKYVVSMANLNLISGMGDGLFGALNPVTREDLAVLLYRVGTHLGIINEETEESYDFADFGDVSKYAKTAIVSLAKNKIISGNGDGSVTPKRTTTRAEAAKMVYSLMQLVR